MVALGRLSALTPAGVSLDLNPLTGLAMVSGVKSSLEDAITFARAGTAWDYDVGGLLRQAAAGMPRLSYHPHSGLPLGLLIEPPSADLWDRTEDFENDAWTKTGLQLYVGSVSGLDGRSIGTRMVDTGSSRGLITRNIAVGSGDAAYSAAFTARAIPGGVRSIEATIHFHGGSGNQGGSAVYDLLLGKAVSGTGASCGMVPAPFGAWRCILAACNTHGHTGITVGLGRWARDPDNGYDVLSISMEAREEATSPMRSGAGLSTRAAETASLAVGDWFNPVEGTFVAEFIANGSPYSDQQVFALRGEGGAFMGMSRSHFGPAVGVAASGVGLAMYGAPQFGLIRAGFTYRDSAWIAAKSGGGNDYLYGSVATATWPVPTSLTTLDIGHYAGGSQLNGYLRRLLYIPHLLSATELSNIVVI